jgi:hypothetical protein
MIHLVPTNYVLLCTFNMNILAGIFLVHSSLASVQKSVSMVLEVLACIITFSILFSFLTIYRGYLECNLQWAVNKTRNEKDKILLYTKDLYILELLLNIVTAEIEALVISGNKFLYACVKDVCHLWVRPRFDTFRQLLIIVEALWSQPVFFR